MIRIKTDLLTNDSEHFVTDLLNKTDTIFFKLKNEQFFSKIHVFVG